ncbi:MAG: hypothetical protein PHO61_04110 [Candidatus ainarchaeum sp.]|jgi:hypothetical protein|nr:hypothetical protein [Candidatus ainarchaeum sp.]MDD3086284.1 hypothetical protein [Candidatus ainarchaeum sp.]OQA30310.1 MAG: hypothetical protein BWY55_00921 [archaeon ADurb.Bin336]
MKPVLGLKIEYLPINSKESGEKVFVTNIKVALGTISKTFITSPLIRDSLAQAKMNEGAKFGGIVARYDNIKKELIFTSYYPIPEHMGTPNPIFVGKGIAARIEARVEERARKVFPEFETVLHFNPSRFRQEQLKNRGFSVWEINKGIKQSEFTKNLRNKLANDLKAKRKIK